MSDSTVPVNQHLNATSLNVMKHTSETIPSMKSNSGRSIFRSKTRETPPVVLIRMEQLAPEGATIANSDGKRED
jgi:hypothetical protein